MRGALVTGAARGIGRAIAERLARDGYLVTVSDVDGDAARRTAGELGVGSLALDVTDAAAVAGRIADLDAVTPLEAVVNNAGIAPLTPLLDTDVELFDRVLAVNVRGVFLVSQAAARAMVPRGRGCLVNICSTSGFTASTGPMAAYDASKAAVRLLTQAMAKELAPQGIRVNAVAPGTVETELVREVLDPAARDRLTGTRIPLGRLGRPGEIADAVAYLCSPQSSYVTGHVLAVDGGWLA